MWDATTSVARWPKYGDVFEALDDQAMVMKHTFATTAQVVFCFDGVGLLQKVRVARHLERAMYVCMNRCLHTFLGVMFSPGRAC